MENIYIYLCIMSLVIVSILGFLSYKNIDEKFSKSFMYAMFFMGLWTLGTTLELSVKSFGLKVFFRNIVQLAMGFASITNYWFVLSYANFTNKIYTRILKSFVAINIISLILVFTDPIHHLMRSKVYLNEVSELTITSTSLGAFYVFLRFGLFGFATLLLFIHLFKTFRGMRKQVLMIFGGFLLALILLLMKQYVLNDMGITIPMSVILIIPYIFINIGVFKYDFLSITPLAKDWVINSLDDGIVVLSKEGKMIEANTSAKTFLEVYKDQLNQEELMAIYRNSEDSSHQLRFDSSTGKKYFEVNIHHLVTTNYKKRGSVAVIRDMTTHMVSHFELKQKAEYDGLTQIFNKQTLEREYYALIDGPLCIMIIDIDRFKNINDTYGHPVGDAVIVGIVAAMKKSIRSRDMIGRIGGDEFCIILTEASIEMCKTVSNRIFQTIEGQSYEVDCDLPPIEVSIGAYTNVEIGDMTFRKAYEKADHALYEAKESGRNRAVIQ